MKFFGYQIDFFSWHISLWTRGENKVEYNFGNFFFTQVDLKIIQS